MFRNRIRILPWKFRLIFRGFWITFPAKPGCYIYKNSEGTVIYVGKAISLRNRVRSYFQNENRLDFKTRQLVKRITNIEWIVVGSELGSADPGNEPDQAPPAAIQHPAERRQALSVYQSPLGGSIPQSDHHPARWYRMVHAISDRTPASGQSIRRLDLLRRIFPYLTCDREITGQDARACLYFDIKLCTAPCIGAIDQKAYRQMIDDLCDFLQGRTDPIVNRLRKEMMAASKELQFEKAATVRDQIQCH